MKSCLTYSELKCRIDRCTIRSCFKIAINATECESFSFPCGVPSPNCGLPHWRHSFLHPKFRSAHAVPRPPLLQLSCVTLPVSPVRQKIHISMSAMSECVDAASICTTRRGSAVSSLVRWLLRGGASHEHSDAPCARSHGRQDCVWRRCKSCYAYTLNPFWGDRREKTHWSVAWDAKAVTLCFATFADACGLHTSTNLAYFDTSDCIQNAKRKWGIFEGSGDILFLLGTLRTWTVRTANRKPETLHLSQRHCTSCPGDRDKFRVWATSTIWDHTHENNKCIWTNGPRRDQGYKIVVSLDAEQENGQPNTGTSTYGEKWWRQEQRRQPG